MIIKSNFFAFFITCIFIFSNGGFLYAQTGDIEASSQEGIGVVFIPSDDELASLLAETPNSGAVVGSLLQTKWGQGIPYRNMLPQGHRSFCGLVATAQIMKFHNHPARGRGRSEAYTMRNGARVPSLNFNITYDWNNMLNSYRSDGRDSNERQRNAVATLIYHVGVARGRDFIRGNSTISTVAALTNTFGYDKSILHLDRRYYNDAEWEGLIRAQLDAGLPILYQGYNQAGTSDHMFIIDGYDNSGRFHINWGWSGRSDGWYSLDALYTDVREWNYNHNMIINIKPDAGGLPSAWEMFLFEFAVSNTRISQNELFTVSARIRNNSPLDIFPGGQLGAALVDANGRIIRVIGSRNRVALNPRSTSAVSTMEIFCYVPETVNPGQYRVMAVIKPEGGEWRLITRSAVFDGVPNAINLTVASAERGATGGGYGMALAEFVSERNSVNRGSADTFRVNTRFRNIDLERFPGGQVGTALVDNNNAIVAVIGTRSLSARDPGLGVTGSGVTNCTVPNTVPPGRYRLMVVVRPGNNADNNQWRIATLSMPGITNSIDFTVR